MKTKISFAINTIEDLNGNDIHLTKFFAFLRSLIRNGNQLEFYRIGSNESLTLIKDLEHLKNFKKSFKFIK
jgi:hypothetical protein